MIQNVVFNCMKFCCKVKASVLIITILLCFFSLFFIERLKIMDYCYSKLHRQQIIFLAAAQNITFTNEITERTVNAKPEDCNLFQLCIPSSKEEVIQQNHKPKSSLCTCMHLEKLGCCYKIYIHRNNFHTHYYKTDLRIFLKSYSYTIHVAITDLISYKHQLHIVHLNYYDADHLYKLSMQIFFF